MKTKVEEVASLLQTMHNQARLIIEKKGGQTLNLWAPIKIFLKNDALMVSEGTECTLFTQRSPIDQAIILENLNKIDMKNPVFYQLELRKVDNVMEHVYGPGAKGMTLEERLPNNAACPDCGENVWHLYANESPEVREGGKPYIYCQNCGYRTHL